MNVLFITLLNIKTVKSHGIYSDLIREFAKHNHNVFVVSPAERRMGENTKYYDDIDNVHILSIKTLNIQKTNIVEKGLGTILIEYQIKNGILKYFNNVRFDLVLYTTPPITIVKPVEYIKKRDKAFSYLMLKDIFPQNAVDLGMMSIKGVKGFLYSFFRNKECELYRISDKIGCMSPANVQYLLKNNIDLSPHKVEICPNSIEIENICITEKEKAQIRKQYDLPFDKKIFIYGGNLGKPQNVSFIIECIRYINNQEAFFLIAGSGTDYYLIENYIKEKEPKNLKLISYLPKEDYDKVVASCDIGLIFLDFRFTIPNFPSRLLSYLQAKIPVVACTDDTTDIGNIIVQNGFGWCCKSNDIETFARIVDEAVKKNNSEKSRNAYNYLIQNYDVNRTYKIIINSIKK